MPNMAHFARAGWEKNPGDLEKKMRSKIHAVKMRASCVFNLVSSYLKNYFKFSRCLAKNLVMLTPYKHRISNNQQIFCSTNKENGTGARTGSMPNFLPKQN